MDPGAGSSEQVASVSPLMPALRIDDAQGAGSLTDVDLMVRYRNGDVRAFELLYQRHKGALYRYLQRMCRHPEAANDVFQEVWGKVIAARERYEVRAQFTTFLFRIAHNCAIDYLRRAVYRHESAMEEQDIEERMVGSATDRPEAQFSHAQLQEHFRRALDALPPEQRDVFLLYEETGLSLEDIGSITGVSMETAKSRLRYAVSKLRAALAMHRTPLHSGVES